MTGPRARSARRPFRAALAALVLLTGMGWLLGGVPTASAHDGLVSTTPATGSAVDAAPGAVELQFTGEPLPLGTRVDVTGPGGRPAAAGTPEIRGATVVQPLVRGLPAGTYRVDWRSTSSDGHALSGSFDFTVGTGGGPAPGPPISPTSAAATGDDDPAIAPTWLAAAGVVVTGLGVMLAGRLRRRR